MSNERRKANRLRQYNEIVRDGRVSPASCKRCLSAGSDCIMDSKNRNCAACTRVGRKCVREFHSESEWQKLDRERDRIDREIREAEEASFQAAERSARASEALVQAFAKVARLRKQQNFLKERGSKMQVHDADLLEQLDEEDPPSSEEIAELERMADAQDAAAQQLASTTESHSLSQILNSPSFWADVGVLSGGTPEPGPDNPSSSR